MAINDTGRPVANSNLLLTSSSDNQRRIDVELSMREVFERELTLINFFNTRAQEHTGARSFRTPRNLTTVTTDRTWDGSAASTPTETASFETDETTWPTTRWLTSGAFALQDQVEGLHDPSILLGDAIAGQLLEELDDVAYALFKAVDVSAIKRDFRRSATTNQFNVPLGTTGSNFIGDRGKRNGNAIGLLDFFNEMAVELARQNVGFRGGRVRKDWNILTTEEVLAEYNRELMEKNTVTRLVEQGLQFQPQPTSNTIFTIYTSNSIVKENITVATGRFAAAASGSTKQCWPIFFIRPEAFTFGVRDRAVITQAPFTPANVSANEYVYHTSQNLIAADDLRGFWVGSVYAE